MNRDLPLKCRCGALRGMIKNVGRSQFVRAVCYCDDCQAYAHFLGRANDLLDKNGGTEILPVVPSSLKLNYGVENLRCLRLSPKGIFRWYAGCCNTPIANTASISWVPYNGVVHAIIDGGDAAARDELLGPIQARIFQKFGIGELPPEALEKIPFGLTMRRFGFMLKGLIGMRYRPSPFFDPRTGKPSRDPYVLELSEREALHSPERHQRS